MITYGRILYKKREKSLKFVLSVPQKCNRSFSALLTRFYIFLTFVWGSSKEVGANDVKRLLGLFGSFMNVL